jgi:drug/metabolite transporter (DMT)-like permease
MRSINASWEKFHDWTFLILCNLIWGSQPTMVEWVQSKTGSGAGPQPGPVFATFFPIAIAALLLTPIVIWERRRNRAVPRLPMTRRDIRDFIILGTFGQIAAQLFVTWGTAPGWSPAANTSLFFLAIPVCTCLMAYFILGERMTKLRVFSFVLAIAGVALCSGVNWDEVNVSRTFFWGNVLIFFSVNGSAFYNVYSKKVLDRYSPLEVLLFSYVAMLALMLPLTIYLEPEGFTNLPLYGFQVWCPLLILAVFVYAVAMILFLSVLSRLDATQAGLSNFLLPFSGVLVAALVLHQRLTLPMILGGLLVLGSTLLITVFEEYQKARTAAEEDVPAG